MTPADAAKVLTLVSVYDNRQFDEVTATAWCDALQGLDVDDCLDAVKAYYRRSRDWIMPVDIREEARMIRRERIISEGQSMARVQIAPPPSPIIDDPQVLAERVAAIKAAVAAVRSVPRS